MDRKTLAVLDNFPKFVKLRESHIENYDEKAAKINFLAICEKLGNDTP